MANSNATDLLRLTYSRAFPVVSIYSSTLQALKGLRPWRIEMADASSCSFFTALCGMKIAELE